MFVFFSSLHPISALPIMLIFDHVFLYKNNKKKHFFFIFLINFLTFPPSISPKQDFKNTGNKEKPKHLYVCHLSNDTHFYFLDTSTNVTSPHVSLLISIFFFPTLFRKPGCWCQYQRKVIISVLKNFCHFPNDGIDLEF